MNPEPPVRILLPDEYAIEVSTPIFFKMRFNLFICKRPKMTCVSWEAAKQAASHNLC